MTDTPSTAVATTDPTAADVELAPADQRRFAALWRECGRLASSRFVPDEYKGDTATVFALARYGEVLGLSPIHAVARLNIIQGRIDVPYDVTLGVLMAHGHEVRMPITSSTICRVELRRRGTDYWQAVEYTIADARRAGHLDMWVEQWVSAASGKKYPEMFVVGDVEHGIDETKVAAGEAWVRKLVDQQKIKSKENWAKHPDDMLAAKAIRRAAKRFAPDAMLQLDDLDFETEPLVEEMVAPVQDVVPAQPAPTDPDEDIVDAELVDDTIEAGGQARAGGVQPPPESTPSGAPPVSAPEVEAEVAESGAGGGAAAADDGPGPEIVEEGVTNSTRPEATSPVAPPSSTSDATRGPMSTDQSKAVHALLRSKLGAVGPARHAALTELLGRPITSASQVTFVEAHQLIDRLNDMPVHTAPEAGE